MNDTIESEHTLSVAHQNESVQIRRRRSSVNDAKALSHLLGGGGKRRLSNIAQGVRVQPSLSGYGSLDTDDAMGAIPQFSREKALADERSSVADGGGNFLSQLPAVIVTTILTVLVGIPFAAAYFPIAWTSQEDMDSSSAENVFGEESHEFPLPGKVALGLRLFIFPTVMCQLVLTFSSSFINPVGLQIVENVPFYHSLAYICFEELGYGAEALSTLLIMFALSTVMVGIAFFFLGYLKLGKVVHFIPRHVLVGLIGGIGVFMAEIAIEVTTDKDFAFSVEEIQSLLGEKAHAFGLLLALEALLTLLIRLTSKKDGEPRFALLAPIYFCLIPLCFFLVMGLFGISFQKAQEADYFFPAIGSSNDNNNNSLIDDQLFDMWKAIDFRLFSWRVLFKSATTILSMVGFSLVNVSIYVPALNVSTDQDADMNVELQAHGYANLLTGLCGGMQSNMSYSTSALYAQLGGKGKLSSLAVAISTGVFFFIGPTLIVYIPRCMAGVILLHLGIGLVKEALVDSFADFDNMEYGGIWFVTVVVAYSGMKAGIVAGILSALSVYIAQSVKVQYPIRNHSSAVMLRTVGLNRSAEAQSILEDDIHGRKRVYIFQLQGHLFFGIVAQLNQDISRILQEHEAKEGKVWIVILDFSHVLGMDASAAQGIGKIKDMLHGEHDVSLAVYVTGKNGVFPSKYCLSEDLEPDRFFKFGEEGPKSNRRASTLHMSIPSDVLLQRQQKAIPADHICDTMGEALEFAEDVLLARQNVSLLEDHIEWFSAEEELVPNELFDSQIIMEEQTHVKTMLTSLLPKEYHGELELLMSLLERQVYNKDDVVWQRGSSSDSVKFLIRGTLVSEISGGGEGKEIKPGQTIGAGGLVQSLPRFSTVRCRTGNAVAYTLSKDSWEETKKSSPNVAVCIPIIAVRDLTRRLQHIDNLAFEDDCRSLPL